jgi:hypothetical protein
MRQTALALTTRLSASAREPYGVKLSVSSRAIEKERRDRGLSGQPSEMPLA